MNPTLLAQNVYGSAAKPVRTDQNTEYDAFARVTLRLKTVSPSQNHPEFVSALHDNRQLWTLLAVDVADDGNRLPQALRAQIFYLAEFTILHTSKVLSGEANIAPLIDINSNVMAGLRQQGTTK